VNNRISQLLGTAICAISLIGAPMVGNAGVIGAQTYLSATDRQAMIDDIDAVLARDDVRNQLERYGVDTVAAGERVAALSDRELMSLAEQIEELPAGGSALGVIGVVFIVLLILELVGVINIFNRI
jgi:hypothetical protein